MAPNPRCAVPGAAAREAEELECGSHGDLNRGICRHRFGLVYWQPGAPTVRERREPFASCAVFDMKRSASLIDAFGIGWK